MTQRLDQLTSPVDVGKYYVVPTVRAVWNNVLDDWPVIGPQHSDAQCFNFDHQHYHPDSRFLPKRSKDEYWYWRSVMASPIQSNTLVNKHGLPKPVWRRRKCQRLINPALQPLIDEHVARPMPALTCHFQQWAGKQSRRDDRGWICPHRAVSLADHAAIDGVITCPLHFLRIDAETGIVLPDPAASGMGGGSMSARTGDWMQTYGGQRFWPIDPRPEDVDIGDIAHALSMLCRYGGHCHQFYSVAEHSVLLARYFERRSAVLALWALLHDASEAYIVDVPRPLKPYLVNYKHFEAQVMTAVAQRFGLSGGIPPEVKEADNRIIADERYQSLKWIAWDSEPGPALGVKLQFWSPFNAERVFATTFRQLHQRVQAGEP